MITREDVEAVLFKMGMSANLKGFGYITDSVLILSQEKNVKITYLYYKVARIYNTTAQRVERSIRHAFETVRGCKGDYDMVEHYIGFINCANSSSLLMLVKRIDEDIRQKEPECKDTIILTGITEKMLVELLEKSNQMFLDKIIEKLI